MNYPKEIKVKDYFKIHNYFSDIYGHGRTIILMQVGSFHETYCTNDKGLNLEQIAQELDIVCTSKNSKKDISESNPRMLGFPVYVIDNFVEKLVDMNYTVVVIDQTTPPPNPERKVTRIESPATFISKSKTFNVSKPSYIVSLYFDIISKSNPLLVCGMTCYDLTTGKGYYNESYSKKNDIHLALDDTIRFMESYPAQEMILEFNNMDNINMNDMNVSNIKSYLKLNEDIIYNITNYEKYKKLKNQNNILDSVFKFENMLNTIENLDMVHYNYARISLVSLLDYVINHQENLISKLQPPKMYMNNNIMYLGNRTLEQLSVLPTTNNKSLYNIICNAKTILGKRFLKNELANPTIDSKILEQRYNMIDFFINNKIPETLDIYLENIYDIEKIIRKMEINIVNPFEITQLFKSLDGMKNIIKILLNYNLEFELNLNDILKKSEEFINFWINRFDIDKMEKINFVNYMEDDTSFFKDNIYKNIDIIMKEINTCNNFLDELVSSLSTFIDDMNYFNSSKKELINIKYNERDGHYLLITNRRCRLLQKSLEKINTIKVGSIDLEVEELEFIELPKSNNTKIKCIKLNNLSTELVKLKQKMAKELKETFNSEIKKIIEIDRTNLHNYCNIISIIDFINSGAICANKLGYCKPCIDNKYNDKSFINALEIRHPIVEQINETVSYCPHNISLGEDINGILLYGINSSGKSTLMKSIGLNIILAQIGYFVASKKFTYYPYKSIFTRINGNDDIYRGLSSFMVEMIELMSILKRHDMNTMIIGDEICRGTEEKSANIIVAYMLETLDSSNSSFITATHLHKIANLPTVKSLKKVKPYHLKVSYDEEKDMIIYKRELTEGQGEKFYGLMVAKYLMKDTYFNDRTNEIMKEFDNNGKKSRYNSELVLDNCYFCNCTENLECHHINWQKDFNNMNINKEKPHLKKNKLYNLMVVCLKCHDMIDSNEIVINGWVDTSKGIELNYTINNEKIKKDKKYDSDTIKLIQDIKNKCSTLKDAKLFIKNNYNIKISSSTIGKIWKNEYV